MFARGCSRPYLLLLQCSARENRLQILGPAVKLSELSPRHRSHREDRRSYTVSILWEEVPVSLAKAGFVTLYQSVPGPYPYSCLLFDQL